MTEAIELALAWVRDTPQGQLALDALERVRRARDVVFDNPSLSATAAVRREVEALLATLGFDHWLLTPAFEQPRAESPVMLAEAGRVAKLLLDTALGYAGIAMAAVKLGKPEHEVTFAEASDALEHPETVGNKVLTAETFRAGKCAVQMVLHDQGIYPKFN